MKAALSLVLVACSSPATPPPRAPIAAPVAKVSHDLRCTWSDKPVASEPLSQQSALGGASYVASPHGIVRASWNPDAGTVQMIGLDGRPLGPVAMTEPALQQGTLRDVTRTSEGVFVRVVGESLVPLPKTPEPEAEDLGPGAAQRVAELVRFAGDGAVKSVRTFARTTWAQSAIRVIPAGNCFVLWAQQALRAVGPKLDLVGDRLTGPHKLDVAHRIVRIGDEHSTRIAVIWIPVTEEYEQTSVQVLDAASATWVAPAHELGVEIYGLAPLGDNAILVGAVSTPGQTTILEGAIVHPDGSIGAWHTWFQTDPNERIANVIIGQRPDGRTLLQFSVGSSVGSRSWAVEVKSDGSVPPLGDAALSSHVTSSGLVGGDGIYVQDGLAIYRWTCT